MHGKNSTGIQSLKWPHKVKVLDLNFLEVLILNNLNTCIHNNNQLKFLWYTDLSFVTEENKINALNGTQNTFLH